MRNEKLWWENLFKKVTRRVARRDGASTGRGESDAVAEAFGMTRRDGASTGSGS